MIAPEGNNSQPEMTELSKAVGKAQNTDDDYLSDQEDVAESAQASMMMHKSGTEKVVVPGAADVLLGRGKPFQSHQGNQLMLQLVDQFRSSYLKSDRKGKHVIIEQVLGFIKERGGRFLMRVDYENYWVEVKRSISYRKVGHAFRSKARRTKRNEPSFRPMVKYHSPAFLGRANLEREMLAMNQACTAQITPSVISSGLNTANPLLRLPARLQSPGSNVLRQQDFVLNELIAMERMGAQQDALAMCRQLQGNSHQMGSFSGIHQSNTSLGRFGANTMDELLLLERMQGRSQQMSSPSTSMFDRRLPSMQGAGVMTNSTGMFHGNPCIKNANQGMFSGQLY